MARILLVDDDPDVRPLLEHIIFADGHEVTTAESIKVARMLLGKQPYDLLVTDVNLPDGSGLTLADQAIAAGIKTLVLTGHGLKLKPGSLARYDYLLKPIEERFGIEQIFVTTMQAVSGAGYPGVPSMDILGNVVPFIKNEEQKMEEETLKLLGHAVHGDWHPLNAKISATCNRVAVEDGHMESVNVKLKKPATREQIVAAWETFAPLAGQDLPTAPEHPLEYDAAKDRPQPRLDRMRGNGMTATIGRLRPCTIFDWKFTVLSHNTIRGAAGAAVLNAEMLLKLGLLDEAARREEVHA